MADVSTVLAGNRAAVDDLIAAADRTGAAWATPRAPGKWSPSQVVEHVARALEESANVVAGTPSARALLQPSLAEAGVSEGEDHESPRSGHWTGHACRGAPAPRGGACAVRPSMPNPSRQWAEHHEHVVWYGVGGRLRKV